MTDGAVARSAPVTLELEPLDVLFFRDGRPFDAGPRATGGLPMPQTLAGAVRTWLFRRLGGDVGALAAAVRRGATFADAAAAQGSGPAVVGRLCIRGPWFARNGERLVPTPATIERDIDGRLHRLDPLADELPGWSLAEMEGARPLWRRAGGPTKPRAGYLCATGLERFLKGGIPRPDEILDAENLFAFEDRVGIAVDAATGTAGEGMIYSVRMMRLRPGISLAVDLVGTREDLEACCPDGEDILAIGGESRRAIVRRMVARTWPAPVNAKLDGDDFTHFVRHATEVIARIGLDYETKTARGQALFYEEFLPSETLFYAVALATGSRNEKVERDAAGMLDLLRNHTPPILQIGADQTIGKGLCAIRIMKSGDGDE